MSIEGRFMVRPNGIVRLDRALGPSVNLQDDPVSNENNKRRIKSANEHFLPVATEDA